MNKNRQLVVNLVSNIFTFGTSILISFFLSPYVVRTLGVEANGFITLANNFVSYASLAAIALNSMAGRFLTIKVHQNDMEGANKFYTTVTMGNMLLAAILLIPSVLCVVWLERIINIPGVLLWDVKLLFALILLNFLISTSFSSMDSATFITNKLYLHSIRNLQSQIIRVAVIMGLFALLKPSVYYSGVAALAGTFFVVAYSYYYKQKLLPDIRLKQKYFDRKVLWELIQSGIWNTLLKAGLLLLSGLDLLVTNLFIGSTEMGMLALAKTLPNVLTQLAGRLTSVFAPSLTIYYARQDYVGLKQELKKGMKITGIILTIPLSVLIVFGEDFFRLWVPSQDAQILAILSVLTCFGLIFTSGIQCLYNIFTVVNKLKVYSTLIFLSGAFSTVIVLILLKTTALGIFAVAGVSSFLNLIRNMLYVVPFAAKYIRLKWNTFVPEVLYSILSVIVCCCFGYGVKQLLIVDSWLMLAAASCLTVVPAFLINLIIVLNKKERALIKDMLMKKIDSIRHPKKRQVISEHVGRNSARVKNEW